MTHRASRPLGSPWRGAAAALVLVAAAFACGPDEPALPPAEDADARGHTAPAAATARANAEMARTLPLGDVRDFEAAERGLVVREAPPVIRDAAGRVVWDLSAYAFLDGEPPDSVNPSLWRQARLNGLHGLYRVTDGVHQVRGYDLANMTVIEGETGWIVVDPLTARETAAAAFALVRRHLGERPVSAVIFTHSHVDHFGGVLGVLSAAEARERGVPVVAPAGFLDEATSENVLAGVVMSRRAMLMYGSRLARGPRGHVGSGLGKEPAMGAVGVLPPTVTVDRTPQELVLDGVRFVFQNAPDSEAPAELTFHLPEKRAFCGAEIVTHNLHNLYTLRGAKVRDALRWSGYIDEALELFGRDSDVVFASHHWPTWGNERVVAYLERQRDVYRYIHDQTLRLAARGLTPREIAETLELPPSLRETFAVRGYYGTVSHNAKAVYQRYFGWFDGNPAHLEPLPPEDAARRYVEALGGAEAALERAREAADAGEYRWAATLLDHLVFAEPEDAEARALLARVYDQLGYRAESGPWRDVYLSGAYELRHGPPAKPLALTRAMDLLRHTPLERFLAAMATRLDGPEADGVQMTLNFVFTDAGETHVLELGNAVLHHRRREADPEADVTVRLTRDFFLRLVTRQAGLRDMIFSEDLDVEGSRLDLLRFFSLLEAPDDTFSIVTP